MTAVFSFHLNNVPFTPGSCWAFSSRPQNWMQARDEVLRDHRPARRETRAHMWGPPASVTPETLQRALLSPRGWGVGCRAEQCGAWGWGGGRCTVSFCAGGPCILEAAVWPMDCRGLWTTDICGQLSMARQGRHPSTVVVNWPWTRVHGVHAAAPQVADSGSSAM